MIILIFGFKTKWSQSVEFGNVRVYSALTVILDLSKTVQEEHHKATYNADMNCFT